MVYLAVKSGLILIVTVGCLQCVLLAETPPSIRAVAILTRHGDRSPVELYVNDPYIDRKWPGGLGALSPKGIQQIYESGIIKNKLFGSLLTGNYGLYSADDMNVRSSAAERCLLSGQSFLAGFFPPPQNRNILPIRWQPIAITSVPEEEDYLLAQKRPCPNYDSTLTQALDLNSPEVDAVIGGFTGLFQYLHNNTGQEIKDMWDIAVIEDTLKVEQDNGLKLPPWAELIYDDLLKPLARLAYSQIGQAIITKIKGGALLSDIIDNLNKFKLGSTKNVFIYAAHDITIVSLQSVLNIADQTGPKPDYGSAITVELHENPAIKNDFEIKFFYFRNSTDVEPIKINIPNSPAPCSLGQFIKTIKSKLVSNYDQKCKEGNNEIRLV